MCYIISPFVYLYFLSILSFVYVLFCLLIVVLFYCLTSCVLPLYEQMSSDSDSDVNSEDEMEMIVCQHVQAMNVLYMGAASIAGKYCTTYLDKADPRTSILSGMGWLQETISTPGETYRMLRVNNHAFFDLHDLLVTRYGLVSSLHVCSQESLAIFLWIVGGCESNRKTQNRFKHSGETISRKFDEVLHCVVKMATIYLKHKDPNFRNVHKRFRFDRRAYPHLKNCIGAIDGTHIRASITGEQQIRYIGRVRRSISKCDGHL